MSNISWEPKMSKCQGWFVAMLSYYHAVVWHMYIKCLMLILGTCWTTFVYMCILKTFWVKNDCLSCCHVLMSCHMTNANVDTQDILNNFCFHVWASNSLVIGEIANVFFYFHTIWYIFCQESQWCSWSWSCHNFPAIAVQQTVFIRPSHHLIKLSPTIVLSDIVEAFPKVEQKLLIYFLPSFYTWPRDR